MLGFAVLALVAGCAAVAWPSDSPVAAVPGGHAVGDTTWSRLYLGFAVAAFVLYVVAALLVSRRGARLAALVVARGRDPARAALRAAPALDRRLDVLELRPHRRGASREPVHDAAERVSRRSGVPVRGRRLAAHDLGLRPGVHARLGAARARRGHVVGCGRVDVQGARGRGDARCRAARCPALARPAFALVLVGWNPAIALDFAGGGHNDAWMAALVLAALALAASGRRQLAGAAWATASLIKWVPLMLLPLRALEARADRPAGAPSRLRGGRRGLVVVATRAYGCSWLRAVVPLLQACAGRLEVLAAGPARAARRPARHRARALHRRRSWPGTPGSLLEAHRGRRGSGSPRDSSSSRPRISPPGTSSGRFRSPPPRTIRPRVARGRPLRLSPPPGGAALGDAVEDEHPVLLEDELPGRDRGAGGRGAPRWGRTSGPGRGSRAGSRRRRSRLRPGWSGS